MVAIGERFTVAKSQEVRDARGRLLARYLPQFDYRITPRNLQIVTEMIAAGTALAGGNAEARSANQVASKPSRVKGAVSTKPAKRKR